MSRMWIIAISALIVGNALTADAQQRNDQWCAYFSNGPINCGFATLEDCIKAIKGKTAFAIIPAQGAEIDTARVAISDGGFSLSPD